MKGRFLKVGLADGPLTRIADGDPTSPRKWGEVKLADAGDEIRQIGDLLRRDRAHHVGHAAVIAMAAVVLVLAKRLGEIVLALVGDARDVLLAKIGL